MTKEPFWKRELKALFAISFTFFIFLVILLIMKKSILDEYHIKFDALGIAVIGSLIFGKVVLIFDNVPLAKKYDHLPKIYSVFIKSFVYLLGFLIFTLLEHLIKGMIGGDGFVEALQHSLSYLINGKSIDNTIIVFAVFLIFSTFWAIRNHVGPKALYRLFFVREK